MANYTEAHNRATQKYREKKSVISITIDKEIGDRWKAQAEDEGISLTKWIVNKIEGEA